MTAVVVVPAQGRGAWPNNGVGGTLASDGRNPGPYYRSNDKASGIPMIGLAGWRANKYSRKVGLNDYATYRATIGVQQQLDVEDDGLWGPLTDAGLEDWQRTHGLRPDAVYGPKSARAMWRPILIRACAQVAAIAEQPQVMDLACGHMMIESIADPGAIGVLSPNDVGLAQINGPSHPGMSYDQRLDPSTSLPWLASFVRGNLDAFNGNTSDAAAAYLLGKGGCRQWIAAGRPDRWGSINVRGYIDKVMAGC